MKITQFESKWLQDNIGKIAFLNHLSPGQMSELITHVTPRVLMGNQPVIKEGEQGKAFFIIYHGGVQVWVERRGKRAKLATLKSGDSFGEISVLTGRPTTANVIANAPTKVFFIDPKQFLEMIRDNPPLKSHIIQVMKKRLAQREKEVTELMQCGLSDINKAIRDLLKS